MRSARVDRSRVLAAQIGLLVVFVGLWSWAAAAKAYDTFYLPAPWSIGVTLAGWVTSGTIAGDLMQTISEMLAGLALGAVIGVALGVGLASRPFVGAVFEPVLVLLNSIPRVTLIPLFIVWFGFTFKMYVFSAFVLVVFVVFFATYAGIRDVDATLVASARVLGAKRSEIVRHVLIPSALSWIFTSLRTAVGFSLIGAVVAEYFGAQRGIGYRIASAQSQFNSTGVFAGIVVLMVFVTIVDVLIQVLQRRLLRWKPAT